MTDEHDRSIWVGFDLGGTKMVALAIDQDGNVVGRCRRKTKAQEGMTQGLVRINQTITDAVEDAGITLDEVKGIGVGCPGPLDLAAGVILEAPNLGWKNVAIGRSIEEEFGCPVVVSNDVDAGVFGEYIKGAGRGARTVVGIFPGTGVGGGCIYEGKILRGANCTCMEIGHIPLIAGGPLDGCGNTGTLEALASRLAISAQAAQAAFRGQAPNLLQDAGTQLEAIRSGQLAQAIRDGDVVIERIVRHAAGYLSLGVVTLVHLLAPDVIILGGGLVEAMPDLLVDEIDRSVRRRVLPAFRDTFTIKAAELGDDATALGAAAWARHEIEAREVARAG
jgi:glucokinase